MKLEVEENVSEIYFTLCKQWDIPPSTAESLTGYFITEMLKLYYIPTSIIYERLSAYKSAGDTSMGLLVLSLHRLLDVVMSHRLSGGLDVMYSHFRREMLIYPSSNTLSITDYLNEQISSGYIPSDGVTKFVEGYCQQANHLKKIM